MAGTSPAMTAMRVQPLFAVQQLATTRLNKEFL
jgi:hypothetical protein